MKENIDNKIIDLPESKPATVYDIAKLAGVSHMTASRVFSSKTPVSEKTRQKVLLAARALNYRPNYLARGLNGGRTRTITFIWDINNSYAPQSALHRLIAKWQEKGYQVNLSGTSNEPDDIKRMLEEAALRGSDSIVLQIDQNVAELLKNELKQHKNLLLIPDAFFPGNYADQLVWDRTAPIRQIVDHFAKIGRKPSYIISPIKDPRAIQSSKVATFLNQLEKYDLMHNHAIIEIASNNADLGRMHEHSTFIAFSDFLKDYLSKTKIATDAFLCLNDEHAAMTMKVLKECGILVPEDIAVVGFNNLPLTETYTPRLASVDRKNEDLVALIEKMVTARLDNPDDPPYVEKLEMQFVWRESAG